MSRPDLPRARMITEYVPVEANRYRWHILRYLRMCTYPAGLSELSTHIGSRVGDRPEIIKQTIRERDLPALAECAAIKYDPESEVTCLRDDHGSFAHHVRRALAGGVISHLKPIRFTRVGDRSDAADTSIVE